MALLPGHNRAVASTGTAAIAILAASAPAAAHVSEQGFVLLLPTDIYILAGVLAVALTVIGLAIIPDRATIALFTGRPFLPLPPTWPETLTSLASLALLVALVVVGFEGVRDPLSNPLPLVIWTVWWIGLVTLQGVWGNFWHWINPWSGIYRLLRGDLAAPGLLTLPERLGSTPAIVAFFCFAAFYLADIAPADPARLAAFVAGYGLYTIAAMLIFGARDWLARGECFTILFRHYAAIAPFGVRAGALHAGFPGWQIAHRPTIGPSAAVLVVMFLATGTFDGINETFWWLELIGINPLAFPGRSAVIRENLLGLFIANLSLVAIFAAVVAAGLFLIGEMTRFREAFARLALSILPIALGYHGAHYLTAFLINGQYVLLAVNDPLSLGWNLFGLDGFHVTTGFFNTRDTVEIIWLAEAAFIVLGHVLAILLAHAIALDMFASARKAMKSQLPLALFMIAYTLLGLALLASPRGA